ncbi:S9 family peptidase [Aestuariibacter salexigens]|uniref:S9 family peptidase n=1 Tax=Aestuariibacter salexigens TaxID=226010 RepID=UPI000550B209|nr:S9 family peptidase [Aestuariibacter salexigens]
MRVLLSSLILITATSVFAQQHSAFSPMDVFELEWASSVQISPDGQNVVYQRNYMDVMSDSRQSRLWLVSRDAKNHVKLTSHDVRESSPAWSPDGTRIAFTSSTENGSEIYVYWLASGKIARLTQLERSPSGLSWSPDGKHIAFSMLVPEQPPVIVSTSLSKPKGAKWAESPRVTTRLNYEQDGRGYLETGYSHLFVIPAEGGTARQITSGDFHHRGTPAWSKDGGALYFAANRNEDWEYAFRNSEIYRVDLGSGEIIALTDRNGPDYSPVVSPDGKQIAYLGYDDKVQTYQVTRLYIMDRDGGNKREVSTGLDRSIQEIQWTNSGIHFKYDDKGDTKLARTSLKGEVTLLAENLGGTSIGRPYPGGNYSVANNGHIAYTRGTAYSPADVALVEGPNAVPSNITALNDDLLPYRTLGEVQEIWYRSSVDDRQIQGWLVFPPGYEKSEGPLPLIVENHGGPIANYGDRFSPEMQLYAAAGYLVFYPNARGSTSYGEEFGNLLYNNYPGDDYHDVMDGVNELIKRQLTTEDKLYVTGGSAGGIMTAWMIGKNNRFKAAAVIKPVINWISKTLVADNYYAYADYRIPGQPWESWQDYWKFSPVSLVGNIQTPTLVMVGTEDLRTPLSEAKQLYNALKLRKVDTALVEMPGAPHFIARRPSQLVSKIEHILAWFGRYE